MSAPVPADDPGRGRPPGVPAELGDGRYAVTGTLGVGGMAVVVRARDHVLDRDVAIKLLADNLSLDRDARQRFVREATLAAAVPDPHVVATFDVGEDAGRPWFVMELIDGPSLADRLRDDGPLDPDDVVDVAADALLGLAAAHAAGLLHRDVKPGNLLCASDGTVKVADFGVAVAADHDRLTRTGFVLGTAAYLAPERRRGAPASVATDLWALGATLTELLTGQPPTTAGAALAGRDDVPRRLRVLVQRLLATEPADRPADALSALELLVGDVPLDDAPSPPGPVDGDAPTQPFPAPAAVPRPQPPVSSAVPATVVSERGRTPTGDTADAPAEAGPDAPDLRTWWRVAVAAVAVLVLFLAVRAAVAPEGSTTDPAPFGPVEVDPEAPAGALRDLADRLRERAEASGG